MVNCIADGLIGLCPMYAVLSTRTITPTAAIAQTQVQISTQYPRFPYKLFIMLSENPQVHCPERKRDALGERSTHAMLNVSVLQSVASRQVTSRHSHSD